MNDAPPEIRIGLVIGQLSQGGAERQITRLALELAPRSQYIPVVFCMSAYTDPYGPELSDADIRWFACPGNLKSGIAKLAWLIRQVKRTRCNLLYGFLHVGNVYSGAAALFLRLPYVASIRNATGILSPSLKKLSRFFLNRAEVVVGNSESCVQVLRQDFQVIHSRIKVVPNIIIPVMPSREARRRLREQWGVASEPVIGTIALVKEQKRPRLFVETCVALNARIPARFVWVGDGPEKGTLEAQVASLEPDIQSRIHLEGSQRDIAAYLSAFDIFLLTSAYEGSPNALLEAMSAQKVCIATRVPGTMDLFGSLPLDRPIGILCDPDDPQKIAQAIADVWQNQVSMHQIGLNAQQWIQTQYAPERVINMYVVLFSSILVSH
jgi:glycosyltransferase involved in cell wall biosynthesis